MSLVWHLMVSDGEDPLQEIWAVGSPISLPLLPNPLWPGVVVPVEDPSMGQTDLFKNNSYSIGPCEIRFD